MAEQMPFFGAYPLTLMTHLGSQKVISTNLAVSTASSPPVNLKAFSYT